jgi:hypothetical protein
MCCFNYIFTHITTQNLVTIFFHYTFVSRFCCVGRDSVVGNATTLRAGQSGRTFVFFSSVVDFTHSGSHHFHYYSIRYLHLFILDFRMGPIRPETSVITYHTTPRNITEQRRSLHLFMFTTGLFTLETLLRLCPYFGKYLYKITPTKLR